MSDDDRQPAEQTYVMQVDEAALQMFIASWLYEARELIGKEPLPADGQKAQEMLAIMDARLTKLEELRPETGRRLIGHAQRFLRELFTFTTLAEEVRKAKGEGFGIKLGMEHCERCGALKGEDYCVGNDECIHGPDGGPAKTCQGWGNHCCRCGADYAKGQI